MNKIIENRPYRHFKGKLYYIHSIATHSETNEKNVVYQTLYPPYEMFIRPIDMFLEKVELNRTDNITNQKYRFELLE